MRLFCARLAARVSVDRGPAIGRAAAQPHLSLVDQIPSRCERPLADGPARKPTTTFRRQCRLLFSSAMGVNAR